MFTWRQIRISILTMTCAFFSLSLAASSSEKSNQQLSCFFFDKSAPEAGMSLLNTNLRSVRAKGSSNESIFVSGNVVDGFFHVQGLTGKIKTGPHQYRILARYENSNETAKALCLKGLQYAFPRDHENLELINIGIKPRFLSRKNYPPVFEKHHEALKDVDKMVVFGDSISDQGNLKELFRFFPSHPYFAGRFSNLLIWIDYLQRTTNISVQNWAMGGSASSLFSEYRNTHEHWRKKLKFTMRKVVSGSLDRAINRYHRKSLHDGVITDPKSTLFIVWIGANDYLTLIDAKVDADTFLDMPNHPRIGSEIMVDKVTENITRSVDRLYQSGARNFMVVNLPDLGKLPIILVNNAYRQNRLESSQDRTFMLSEKMTAVSVRHNQVLQEKLKKYEAEHADLNLIYGDAFAGVQQANSSMSLEDDTSYFNYDVDKSLYTPVVSNNRTIYINRSCYHHMGSLRSGIQTCVDPNRTFYWDAVHPSSFGHCLIASLFHRYAANRGFLNPVPMNDYLKLCRPELAI